MNERQDLPAGDLRCWRALARAKILTMLQDLAGRIRGGELGVTAGCREQNKERVKDNARRWFYDRGSDLAFFCELAGYDPDYVRRIARRVELHGLPQWRAEAGKGKHYEARKATRRARRGLR